MLLVWEVGLGGFGIGMAGLGTALQACGDKTPILATAMSEQLGRKNLASIGSCLS